MTSNRCKGMKGKNRIKKSVVLTIMFFAVIFSTNLSMAKEVLRHSPLDDFTAHLDETIPALMEKYSIPGVNIALVEDGKTSWTRAYGYADIEKGRKMTTDTCCRVESISKSVTAWGVMKLVQEGRIELDKPAAHYIKNWKFPESQFHGEKITIRQLLTHTAGMPLGDFLDRYPPEEKIPSLEDSLYKKAVLFKKPGSPFSYSNTGYNLLELLIEEVTGRDFSEYMEEEILVPLGMCNSTFTWSEEMEPPVPVGYDLKGGPVPVYVYPEKASGGLFAPVGDIAAFVSAGMTTNPDSDHEVLTYENINKLYAPMVEKIGVYDLIFDFYGMGYYIETLSDGRVSAANGGQGGGVMTYFQFVPETGDGIVILTNSQRSWPFFGYILRDWSRWRGFASVGFGKIIRAQKALWAIIGLMWFVISLQLWRLVGGIISGRRWFAPLSNQCRPLRLAEFCMCIIIVSGLLWCMSQEYLFISSVFPIASIWLGFSAFAAALVLLLLSFFPLKVDVKSSDMIYNDK